MLPIEEFKQEIINTVAENSVTVIVAETGAGKSTQVPQYLMSEYDSVCVTQPRRLAARAVATRVAQETKTPLGDTIGLWTGEEKQTKNTTKVVFCTDGLELVLTMAGKKNNVLIIDEVHEFNRNIETLLAWTKPLAEKGQMKLVLMSATIDVEKLLDFYGDIPIINVPGRTFPVSSEERKEDHLIRSIEEEVNLKHNTLVFLPGVREIKDLCNSLQQQVEAEILPLYGALAPEKQDRCFHSYDLPKVVVATNVAQTSITIPGIDTVIDSGIERRIEVREGIEGLYLHQISRADCAQRKGRAGRTKEGKYILCGKPLENRERFPTTEIERTRLDQLVLRLAAVGVDATKVEFFHQPEYSELLAAKKALIVLGAITDDGKVTAIGKRMAKLPLSVHLARMVIAAEKYGVVADVITIAAIMEAGGLRDRTDAWRDLTQETESDLLVELDLWKQAEGCRVNELIDNGIFKKAYFRAKTIRKKLFKAVKCYTANHTNRDAIKIACVAGMVDNLYKNYNYCEFAKGSDIRRVARESVVMSSPELVVGIPKDIQFKNRRGTLCTLNLLGTVTKVTSEILIKAAPHLVAIKDGLNPKYDPHQDSCVSTTEMWFNGERIHTQEINTPTHPKASEVFVSWLSNQM